MGTYSIDCTRSARGVKLLIPSGELEEAGYSGAGPHILPLRGDFKQGIENTQP